MIRRARESFAGRTVVSGAMKWAARLIDCTSCDRKPTINLIPYFRPWLLFTLHNLEKLTRARGTDVRLRVGVLAEIGSSVPFVSFPFGICKRIGE